MGTNSSPLFFISMGIIILGIFPDHVTSSGAYMRAYLRRQNLTKEYFQGTKDLPDAEKDLSVTHDNYILHQDRLGLTKLKNLDEKYSTCHGIDIRELTISEVQTFFDIGQLTSLELTKCYLQRIHQMNSILKSVLELNPNAISEAYRADRERASYGVPHQRNPMHGIPILLKDNVATKDHMQTTAGSWALFGLQPKTDAHIVKVLRKAGVVIIGKSNLSEFSAFRALRNGWSGRGGQALSPYNLDANPYGSSTGSATGVAANFAMVSIGTETDGSLITPANAAGIFALKPTLGTISTQGVIPISKHQDCVGPMARTSIDLAILFDEMVPIQQKEKRGCGGSFLQCLLKQKYFKKFRIGILEYPYWDGTVINSYALKHQLPLLKEVVHSMRNFSSIRVIDDVVPSPPDLFKRISCDKELTVLTHDFKHEINEYLSRNVISHGRQKVGSLKDIINYNRMNPDGMGQGMLELAEETDGIYNKVYIEARESNQFAASELLNSTIYKYKLDALVFPNPSFDNGLPNAKELDDVPVRGYQLAAIAGYPSINVPAGIGLKGVPFGMTFIGMPEKESKLLQIAFLLESLNPARRMPQFLI